MFDDGDDEDLIGYLPAGPMPRPYNDGRGGITWAYNNRDYLTQCLDGKRSSDGIVEGISYFPNRPRDDVRSDDEYVNEELARRGYGYGGSSYNRGGSGGNEEVIACGSVTLQLENHMAGIDYIRDELKNKDDRRYRMVAVDHHESGYGDIEFRLKREVVRVFGTQVRETAKAVFLKIPIDTEQYEISFPFETVYIHIWMPKAVCENKTDQYDNIDYQVWEADLELFDNNLNKSLQWYIENVLVSKYKMNKEEILNKVPYAFPLQPEGEVY